MIDNFALGITHALMLIAAWRLVTRVDPEDAPPRDWRRRRPPPSA